MLGFHLHRVEGDATDVLQDRGRMETCTKGRWSCGAGNGILSAEGESRCSSSEEARKNFGAGATPFSKSLNAEPNLHGAKRKLA